MSTMTQGEIVGALVQVQLSSMGIGLPPGEPQIARLSKLSLQDMLDAVRQVEADNEAAPIAAGSRTFSVVPDDRLVAAIYTWLHYCAPGYHDVGDNDDAIVHLRVGGALHGLVKWVREVPP